jgi:hypothetical protein
MKTKVNQLHAAVDTIKKISNLLYFIVHFAHVSIR